MKVHSIWIRHCCLGIYFGSYIYYHVHGHDLPLNGGNQRIFLCICWQYLSQVGSGASPKLASLCFFSDLRLYCWFLFWSAFLHWWFLGIIFLHWWQCCMLLWFWGILTGSVNFIWWRNKCRWWIMLLIMNEHWYLSFYKPTHDLEVAGWN